MAWLPADLDLSGESDHAFGVIAKIGYRYDLRLHAADASGVEFVDLRTAPQRGAHRLQKRGVVGKQLRHAGIVARVDQADVAFRHRTCPSSRDSRCLWCADID